MIKMKKKKDFLRVSQIQIKPSEKKKKSKEKLIKRTWQEFKILEALVIKIVYCSNFS